MKATEQYFPVVLFIMLFEVVLTFESVDEILKCDHSNERYWAVLTCGTVYYAVRGGSNFRVCGWNPKMWPFEWKLLSSTSLCYCLLYMLYKMFLPHFESVDQSCWEVLFFGAVYWTSRGSFVFSWLHTVFLLFESFNNKDLRFILCCISQQEIASFSWPYQGKSRTLSFFHHTLSFWVKVISIQILAFGVQSPPKSLSW